MDCLKVMENLPFLSELLLIADCKGLHIVSNVPQVRELRVGGCPKLSWATCSAWDCTRVCLRSPHYGCLCFNNNAENYVGKTWMSTTGHDDDTELPGWTSAMWWPGLSGGRASSALAAQVPAVAGCCDAFHSTRQRRWRRGS
ncbi:hypothetical protein EJB05_25893, partial [Eragrostis curvula]